MGSGDSKTVSASLWLYTTSSVNDSCTYLIIKLSNVLTPSQEKAWQMTVEGIYF